MIILCQSKLQCLHWFIYLGIYNPESETGLKFGSLTPVSFLGYTISKKYAHSNYVHGFVN